MITLIALNVLLLVWLRIIRPNGDRTELIMAMIGCLCTMGVYICGLILLANPNGSAGFRSTLRPPSPPALAAELGASTWF